MILAEMLAQIGQDEVPDESADEEGSSRLKELLGNEYDNAGTSCLR